ncbi:hypothetical protein [Escherichia marmotae]|uniref:hypothetical protein n=1 Tax=Escherichia marmotae TaxID=1499973 RepID=UPI002F312EFA
MTSNNNAAYLRGRRIAMRWKRIKTFLYHIDMFCINVARKHHLPGWTGRIPVMLLLTIIAICGIFSLFAALCCFLLIAAPFSLMAMMKNFPEIASTDDNEKDLWWWEQQNSYEVHGAPYKNPGDK